ncbi:MAG TPA: c-type cytochrome [Steroidobacteraceae bacterium]|nr:c-type cytochrome [Steroidobacteraceae bacterium]
MPGSTITYTDRQLDDEFFIADWFPAEHPPMPKIVASGRKPAMPCALCHMVTGNGGPAEAALPGLPASYIIEQVGEFRAGRRAAAQPAMISAHDMVLEAKAVSAADLAAAARYFSQLRFISHFHVVESDTAPRTRVGGVSLYIKIPGAGSEPLGARIVEVPSDTSQWELDNPHVDFTAYVPQGSIERGQSLVTSGDGAAPCRTCHGSDLRGTGIAPPLAGRSPSYLARQLYDIRHGTRRGPAVALMLPEVAHMTPADRIAIVAYLGSLPP